MSLLVKPAFQESTGAVPFRRQPSSITCNVSHWIGLRENLTRKPWFFPASLCGVLVYRFAPAASASARPAAIQSQLITAPLMTAHHSTTHHSSSQHHLSQLITAQHHLSHPRITAQLITPLVTTHSSQHNSSQLITAPLITSHSSQHISRTQHISRITAQLIWAAASFRVAGAVHGAFWRSWCARGRRWAAAQYTESCGGAGARVGAAGPRLAFVWQAAAQYTEPSGGAGARVAAAGPQLAFVRQAQYTRSLLEELVRAWAPLGRGWLSCGRRSTQSLLEELRVGSQTIFDTPLCHTPSFTHNLSHHFVTNHLSHTIFHHTIFHTQLCHTLSSTHNFHTPSFSHNFVTHHLWHTIFHTIFDTPSFTPLCHTPFFTRHFVKHHLSHTIFDTTSLTHTIFHTPSQTSFHTPSFTHHFVTHNTLSHTIFHTPSFTHHFVTHHLSHSFFAHHLSHTTLSNTIFHTPSLTPHFWHTPSFTQLFHTPSFTHHFVTYHLSHTTFHHTIFVTHHLSPYHLSSTSSCVFPSFPVPATTFLAHYWKKLTCGVIRSFYYHSLNIGFSCKFYHHPILWVSHHIQNLPSSSLVAGFTPTICPFLSEHARWMGNLIAESKSTYRAVEIHPFRGCDICPFTPCLRQISDKLKSFPLRDHLAEISCGVHTPQSSLCKDGSYRFCVLLLGISFRCRIWWSPAGWLFFFYHPRSSCTSEVLERSTS